MKTAQNIDDDDSHLKEVSEMTSHSIVKKINSRAETKQRILLQFDKSFELKTQSLKRYHFE